MHPDHIHLFFGKDFGDVSQQTLSVHGLDRHIHRVNRAFSAFALPPAHIDDPFSVAQSQFAEVAAVLTVDAHPLTPGDKTTNQIGRCGFAAARELCEQGVHTHNQDARRRFASRCAFELLLEVLILLQRRLWRVEQYLDVAQRKFVFAHHLKQAVGRFEPQLTGQVLQADRGAAQALQGFFNRFASFGDGFLADLRIEPSPYLGACTRTGQKTQFGVEPVAGRTTFFDGGDFDGLTIGQRRVQGHHGTVHFGPATTVPQIGVHCVSKVNRCGALRQFNHGSVWGQHVNSVIKNGVA